MEKFDPVPVGTFVAYKFYNYGTGPNNYLIGIITHNDGPMIQYTVKWVSPVFDKLVHGKTQMITEGQFPESSIQEMISNYHEYLNAK